MKLDNEDACARSSRAFRSTFSSRRRLLLASALAAPLALAFASDANAQIVRIPPRIPIILPRKIAVVAATWDDRGFNAAATASAAALKAAGWTVHVLNDSTGHKDTSVADMIRAATADATSIDQVFIDLHAHGSGLAKWYNVTDFNGNFGGMWMDPYEALAYPETMSLSYPYSDPVAERAHWTNANIPGGQTGIWGSDLEAIAKELDARSVPTTILDHSCDGGNTVRLIEDINSPNLCAIATAGVASPGLVGYPWTASVLTAGSSFEDVAKFISTTYDTDKHPHGDRLFSTGYRNGCTGTMPIRETMASAIIAYTTWPTQMRWTESFVARSPSSYTNFLDYAHGLPDGKGNRDAGFDPVHANPGGPGAAAGGGQGRWGAESVGEVRWFQESINKFLADNTFTYWIRNPGGYGFTPHTSRSPAVDTVGTEANKTLSLVYAHRTAFDSLNAAIGSHPPAWYDITYGELIRESLVYDCVCPVTGEVTVLAKAAAISMVASTNADFKAQNGFDGYAWDCSTLGPKVTGTRLSLGNSGAYSYAGFTKDAMCADPSKAVDRYLSIVNPGGAWSYLTQLRTLEAQLTSQSATTSRAISAIETTCSSAACAAQKL